MGAIIVLVMTNGLIRLGLGTGANQMVLGMLLGVAVTLDIRWLKNRHKVLDEVYVAPIYPSHGRDAIRRARLRQPLCARRPALRRPNQIGLGELEGPEDVVARRRGSPLLRHAPWRDRPLLRARTTNARRSSPIPADFRSGSPSTATGNLISCVGAMGLYSISQDGEVTRLSAETKRSWTSIVDDARLRDPNDCDIAPDGRIFFTDSTKRYDAHEWALDSIESRPTGRLLCYDPQNGKTTTVLEGLPLCQWRLHGA